MAVWDVAKSKLPRKLVAHERTFRYRTEHEHPIDTSGGRPKYSGCTELLYIWIDRQPRRALTVAFRAGEGRLVHDGGMGSHAGMVILQGLPDGYLNLHEPGVVRAFIDVAMRRGWVPDGAPLELDGWEYVEDVVRRRRASATP